MYVGAAPYERRATLVNMAWYDRRRNKLISPQKKLVYFDAEMTQANSSAQKLL